MSQDHDDHDSERGASHPPQGPGTAATRRRFLCGGTVALLSLGGARLARAGLPRAGSGPAAAMTTSGTVYIDASIDGSSVDYSVAVGLDGEGNPRWSSYAGEVLLGSSDEIAIELRVYKSNNQRAPSGLTVTASPGPIVQDTSAGPHAVFDLGAYSFGSGPVAVSTSISFDQGSSAITITLANDADDVGESEPTIIVDDDMPDPGINPVG